MADDRFPSLPLEDWRETKTTLHIFSQIVGKVRLALHPKLNHWWHVPFYVSARGFTTATIPAAGGNFEAEFDLTDHQLVIRTSRGQTRTIPLENQTVATFYRTAFDTLSDLSIHVKILPKPFDPSRVGSNIPFPDDEKHGNYDPAMAHRYWQVLVALDPIFKEFRGRFLGKCSPVHLFWHSLDLAVTRFSGKRVPPPAEADPVTREAYSHEVISAGFWVGDDNLPEPAFYCYAAPEPGGLADEPLRPDGASWVSQNGSSMAIWRYDDMRASSNPGRALLEFLQSSYEAGAKRAKWPRQELEMAK